MSESSHAAVPVEILSDGKPPQAGMMALTNFGQVEIYKIGRMNRQLLTRNPAKFEMFVDREAPAVVIDGRRFGLAANDVDRAEALLAEAQSRIGPKKNALPAPSGVPLSRPASSSVVGSNVLHSLASWAGALVTMGYVLGILGIAGGLILAIQSEASDFGQVDYPYVIIGISIAANAAFFALLGVVVGKLAQAYAANNRGG